MAYDLEEQEQIDELKAWWKQNGKLISTLVIGLLVAYAAYQGWHYYQNKQAVEASTQYQDLLVTEEKDLKAIQAKSAVLMEKFGATPYAGRAALLSAKANYQANEIKSAKAQLEWTIKNAKETSVSALASLQLANILAEEKDYEAALKLLNAPHDAGFDGLFADLKGDILVSQGKTPAAKAAYEEALIKLEPQGKFRAITQQKLEALG
ncbi:tetratricopeptide repeat protein [Methylotenera sp.]|uniref:tetratricopeptide repeat protein n=1 Tax=Methylotenera sp. TaxID=2051956 RepID=UPI00271FDB7C|nr:tetratricopeptide repeat protein [Methylotenera sp.]MDO9204547.1 tetratricopeptide repeat protein [Methylotenera sp.]MDP1523197.1 tetratricopeptide repeat protein [Methylotenera sp.]MDP2230425.1 tetratricopeptide repeat protein [Methylotenera sp.]MDP3141376.1 tetratricopeptide repeat protein [Methylotenera sp.]MDP3306990.1 tetratricopeptide repeat protein [Methylotenera sp.]